jgi:hypothetical protein
LALHIAIHHRWRKPAALPAYDNPYGNAVKPCAKAVVASLDKKPLTLEHAAILGRATGRDWISRIDATWSMVSIAQSEKLAQICFRDPISARHIRSKIGLPDLPASLGLFRVEADWLRGKPVLIKDTLPHALIALWVKAAKAQDNASFMRCVRVALQFQPCGVPNQIKTAARRIAAQAILDCESPDLEIAMQSLLTLMLLDQLFQPCQQLKAAA